MDPTAGAPVLNCRHHWLIEVPNGPTSHGHCKRCGLERDFFNNPEDARIGAHEAAAAAA
jgi:hypothetical protein